MICRITTRGHVWCPSSLHDVGASACGWETIASDAGPGERQDEHGPRMSHVSLLARALGDSLDLVTRAGGTLPNRRCPLTPGGMWQPWTSL